MVKPTLASEPDEGPCRRRELDKAPASAIKKILGRIEAKKLIEKLHVIYEKEPFMPLSGTTEPMDGGTN